MIQSHTAQASKVSSQETEEVAAPYKRPAGLSLMFCSRAEILAAPAEEREAYYRIVGAFPDHLDINAMDATDPVHFHDPCKLTDDQFDDNYESVRNGDGRIY